MQFPMKTRAATFVLAFLFPFLNAGHAQDSNDKRNAKLPGHTANPAGEFNLDEYELESGPKVFKGIISVPENRASNDTRNIQLYFYQIKATDPSDLPPVVFLPGGPGGYYDDNWVNVLAKKPGRSGSVLEALTYLKHRDVLLINQRGARLPDRSYQIMNFFAGGGSIRKPRDNEAVAESIKEGVKRSVDHWTSQGVDLAGYDIANMIEDIDDIRKSLGYEKIVLRGNSFGSQWSFSYMKKYPEHVDRAILGGVEPIDHGYDSPDGVWNVFQRLEEQIEIARVSQDLGFPEIKLTDAIKEIVERLEKEPVSIELESNDQKKEIPIGADDFRNYLRTGINAPKESIQTRESFPKFIYEIYNEDYRYLAARIQKERGGPIVSSIQGLLIDNSLGISPARDQKLDKESARRWLGEINLFYKATREVSPTPVIPDDFRNLQTTIPILMLHGDSDLSTPIENAEEFLQSASNSHLVRIHGGTHGAIDEMQRADENFLSHIESFLNADLKDDAKIRATFGKIPVSFHLPELKFAPLGGQSLFEELENQNQR